MREYYTELHLHTYNGSNCAKVRTRKLVKEYYQAGYDTIVCTNHFAVHNLMHYVKGKTISDKVDVLEKDFLKLKNMAEKYGINVLYGIELASNGNELPADILIYNVSFDELREIGERLIHIKYDELHELAIKRNWLVAQAHPYREQYSPINDQYIEMLEVYNGHPRHKNRNELAYQFAIDHNLIGICGSDYHDPGCHASAIATSERINSIDELLTVLRSKRFRIVENIDNEHIEKDKIK